MENAQLRDLPLAICAFRGLAGLPHAFLAIALRLGSNGWAWANRAKLEKNLSGDLWRGTQERLDSVVAVAGFVAGSEG